MPGDFFEPRGPRGQTWQEQLAMAEMITAVLGGIDQRGKK